MNILTGILCGALLTLAAIKAFYGAPETMRSSSAFGPSVYYIVGDKRFDWFRRGGPNYLGGFTLDGRRISAVFVSRDSDGNPTGRNAEERFGGEAMTARAEGIAPTTRVRP